MREENRKYIEVHSKELFLFLFDCKHAYHKIIKSRGELLWLVSLSLSLRTHTLTHAFGNRGDPT
jgi:hypothetical protein